MPDEIQPALTPDEWKREVPTSLHSPDTAIQFGVGHVVLSGEWPIDRIRSAMIALLNHSLPDDDPRKITREDVRTVEDAYSQITMGVRVEGLSMQRLWDLAAKLAALLPPGE